MNITSDQRSMKLEYLRNSLEAGIRCEAISISNFDFLTLLKMVLQMLLPDNPNDPFFIEMSSSSFIVT